MVGVEAEQMMDTPTLRVVVVFLTKKHDENSRHVSILRAECHTQIKLQYYPSVSCLAAVTVEGDLELVEMERDRTALASDWLKAGGFSSMTR